MFEAHSFKFGAAAYTAEVSVTFGLPAAAPELYKNRTHRDEDAYTFFLRVWSPWLNQLTKNRLGKLDPELKRALYDRRKTRGGRHTDLRFWTLPTKAQTNDKALETHPDIGHLPRKLCPKCRDLLRLFRTQSSRKHRNNKKEAKD
jgi:hypothetical protein